MKYFKNLSLNKKIIVLGTLSLFLPIYLCLPLLLCIIFYLIYKGEILKAYKSIDKSCYIIYFCILSFIVSLYYKNYVGALCVVGILLLMTFILFYRMYIDRRLFEYILRLTIFLSLFAAFIGFIEYTNILDKNGIDSFQIIIYSKRTNRINSMYFNANYYAMMLEFFICIAFYKICILYKDFKHKYKSIFKYTLTILINLFMLLLTGCRTAWPALAVGLLVIVILDKHKHLCFILGCIVVCSILFFIVNPDKFPRIDSVVSYFFTRKGIWMTAIENIKVHPLFGEGPMTYWHIYHLYNGHNTHHAHSVYLDPILNFGIIGISIIFPYVYSNIKRIISLSKNKRYRPLFALIISFIMMVLVHGVMDVTIFFVHTALLFMFIISAFEIDKSFSQKNH